MFYAVIFLEIIIVFAVDHWIDKNILVKHPILGHIPRLIFYFFAAMIFMATWRYPW